MIPKERARMAANAGIDSNSSRLDSEVFEKHCHQKNDGMDKNPLVSEDARRDLNIRFEG
jgi:hypothetical protein